MPEIPLILRLKKQAHKDISRSQDLIVEAVYEIFDKAVMHGGTVIWRCYSGNRFSEDIDMYIPRDLDKISAFFKALEKKGFIIEKKKIGENSLYSKLRLNSTHVSFEALFKIVNGELADYETADGNFIVIKSLLPEDLIKEKVNAYLARQKIRDIYDIFHLLKFVKEKKKIKDDLGRLLKNLKQPLDERDLSVLIISGVTPTFEQIVNYIKREA